MPITRASAWWRGSRPTIAWCWSNERPPHLHPPGAHCRDRALSVDGAVLPGAVRLRAEDQPVPNRDRPAAPSAGVRPDASRRGGQGVVVGAVSTSIVLAIGSPIAYGMARLPLKWQPIAMMLVIVPFWTSFLIRIYAWINILQHDGLLIKILLA